ncbi:MAG: hypothetical protein QM679_08065 [Patulibacter sp.]
MNPVKYIDIARAALRAYLEHAGVVLAASAVINGAALLLSVLLMNLLTSAGFVLYLLILFVAQQVTTGAATLLMAGLWQRGAAPTIGELVRGAAARGAALSASALLYSYGILVFVFMGVTLITLSTIYGALPGLALIGVGLFFGVRWSIAIPALLLRRQGIRDAFTTSMQLTGTAPGTAFKLVGLMIVVNGIAPRLVAEMVGGGHGAALETIVFTSFVASAIVAPLPGLAYGELYLRLAGDAHRPASRSAGAAHVPTGATATPAPSPSGAGATPALAPSLAADAGVRLPWSPPALAPPPAPWTPEATTALPPPPAATPAPPPPAPAATPASLPAPQQRQGSVAPPGFG